MPNFRPEGLRLLGQGPGRRDLSRRAGRRHRVRVYRPRLRRYSVRARHHQRCVWAEDADGQEQPSRHRCLEPLGGERAGAG